MLVPIFYHLPGPRSPAQARRRQGLKGTGPCVIHLHTAPRTRFLLSLFLLRRRRLRMELVTQLIWLQHPARAPPGIFHPLAAPAPSATAALACQIETDSPAVTANNRLHRGTVCQSAPFCQCGRRGHRQKRHRSGDPGSTDRSVIEGVRYATDLTTVTEVTSQSITSWPPQSTCEYFHI